VFPKYRVAVTPSPVQRIIIIGAGGHARVCLDALRDDPRIEVTGAVSRDGTGVDGLGVPLLGDESDLEKLAESGQITTFCVAIGSNLDRERLCRIVTQSGWVLTQAISGSAHVSPSAVVGVGCHLLPGAVVNAATSLGTGVIVNTNASVDHDCAVGDFVHVAPGAVIGGGVTVGERTLIGLGASVLPGVSIGADAVIGGGAVVIRDVLPGTTVVGNPARSIRG
jgi:UDP-perosamine 4-acetyltransferase